MNRQEKISLLNQTQSGQIPFSKLLATLQPLRVERLTVDEKYLLLNIERDIKQDPHTAKAPGVIACKNYYRKVSNQRSDTLPDSEAAYRIVKHFYKSLNITNRWPKLFQQ